MTNNYRRNHNILIKRYCGYHKRKKKQKELERLKKVFRPRIEELVRNILSPKEYWKMKFIESLMEL